MKRLSVLIIFFLFVISGRLYSQATYSPDITAADLKSHISYLASDELKGRYTGSPGGIAASEYIRDQFKAAGLKLLGNDGFQPFEVVVSVKAGPGNSLKINGKSEANKADYTPFPFSKNGTVSAGVAFAGYGFEINTDSLKWNDYEGLDVNGKWVMILRGDPEIEKQESHFVNFGDDRDKVILARDKGAAGVIFVSGKKFDAKDELVSMYSDKTQSTAGLPVIHIKRSIANEILMPDHLTVDTLESVLIAGMKPNSKVLSAKVDATDRKSVV